MIEISWAHRTQKIAVELRFSDTRQHRLAERVIKAFGYRKHGNSVFHFGKLDTLRTLTERLEENAIPFYVTPTVKRVLRYLRECLLEQRDEYRARLKRMRKVGLELKPFQRKDALKMAISDSIINALPPGLGKTVCALAAIPDGVRCLVVCPAVMRLTWAEETKIWRPEIEVSLLKKADDFAFPTKPNSMLIMNYEQLPPCSLDGTAKKKKMMSLDERMRAADDEYCTLVLDECHYIKNYSAGRTKRARTIAARIRKIGGRCMGLTGTPLTNKPTDLWTLLQNFDLARDCFGDNANFIQLMGGYSRMEYGRRQIFWSGKPDPTVGDLISPYVITRSKESVWSEMPAKVFSTTYVELKDPKVRKFLDTLQASIGDDDLVERLTWITKTKPETIAQYSEFRAALAMVKYSALVSMLDDYEDEHIVVMSAHRQPIELLGERKGWGMIHGGIKEKVRDKNRTEFQAGNLKGIACTIQAAGVGLTLTKASRMFFIDQCWNPSDNEQAQDRIHRIGQGEDTCYYHLFTINHPLEKLLDKALRTKQKFVDGSIGEAQLSRLQELSRLDTV